MGEIYVVIIARAEWDKVESLSAIGAYETLDDAVDYVFDKCQFHYKDGVLYRRQIANLEYDFDDFVEHSEFEWMNFEEVKDHLKTKKWYVDSDGTGIYIEKVKLFKPNVPKV